MRSKKHAVACLQDFYKECGFNDALVVSIVLRIYLIRLLGMPHLLSSSSFPSQDLLWAHFWASPD